LVSPTPTLTGSGRSATMISPTSCRSRTHGSPS
jgi:hypothetical protein